MSPGRAGGCLVPQLTGNRRRGARDRCSALKRSVTQASPQQTQASWVLKASLLEPGAGSSCRTALAREEPLQHTKSQAPSTSPTRGRRQLARQPGPYPGSAG